MDVNTPINLSSFSINNFRVFSEHTNFDFAPITILTGTNSSGKSSLTKALALLAKSYQLSGLRKLNYLEADLKIGNFNSFINNKTKSKTLAFELKINPHNIHLKLFFISEKLSAFQIFQNDELILSELIDKNFDSQVHSFIKLPETIINREKLYSLFVTLSDQEFNLVCDKLLAFLQHLSISPQHYLTNKSEDIFTETFNSKIEGLKEINTPPYEEEIFLEGEVKSVTLYSNPLLLDIIPELVVNLGLEGIRLADYLNLELLSNLEFPLGDSLNQFFNQFVFISGVRAKQEFVYTASNSPLLFSQLQKYADNSEVKSRLYSMLKKWLVDEFKIMDLPDAPVFSSVFEITEIEDLGYSIQLLINNTWTHLADLGYGVTQFLPIILSVALNEEAKTYIIEEPESNLHPALQSKLADFFFEAMSLKKLFPNTSKYSVDEKIRGKISSNRFIIETHSEYLIRKLQYLTASSKSKMNPDDTVIYYFYSPNAIPPGYPQIQKINITKGGGLTHDFGTGFFDEADNIALSIWGLNSKLN